MTPDIEWLPSRPLLLNDYSRVAAVVNKRNPPISVVIPHYNRVAQLALTLAALTRQTYSAPYEIVIADDGSSDNSLFHLVRRYDDRLDIVLARQADKGFRLARTANLGIRSARYEHIVVLQCDVIPSPELLASFGVAFASPMAAIFLGHRIFVSAENVSESDITLASTAAAVLPSVRTKNPLWAANPAHQLIDWRLEWYANTSGLTAATSPFRAVVGSLLGFSKQLFSDVGGFNESFETWGGEDGEFGYRAYNSGAFIVPLSTAIGYHQEPPGGRNETDRVAHFVTSKRLRNLLCALPPFRFADGPDVEVEKLHIYSTFHVEQTNRQRMDFSTKVSTLPAGASIFSLTGHKSVPYVLLMLRPMTPEIADAARELVPSMDANHFVAAYGWDRTEGPAGDPLFVLLRVRSIAQLRRDRSLSPAADWRGLLEHLRHGKAAVA